MKQEKQHEELIQGVEAFDKNQGLKHTTTSEKVVLPSAEGVLFCKLVSFFVFYLFMYLVAVILFLSMLLCTITILWHFIYALISQYSAAQ